MSANSDTDNCYCGILDTYGLRYLAVRTDEATSDFYKETKATDDSCLIQTELSPSQVDIIADLHKNKDSAGAAIAMVAFTRTKAMGVAEDQQSVYTKLEALFNKKKRKKL